VADDYIRNFLIRAGMNRSLDCFNTEWYEMKSTGALPPDDLQRIPDAYAQNHLLEEEVARLRTELVHAREIAGRAQATWDKFRKERDFHRMHHKRVVQEKNRLIVDLRRLRVHYEKYEPLLGELKSKYELAMKEKMLTRLDRDRQAARVAALEGTLAAGEGGEGGLGASMAAGGTSRAQTQHKTETSSPPRSQSAMTQGAPTGSKDKRDAATVMFAKQAPTGVLSHTAASRARWLDRLQSGPMPPVVANAQAAAQAATAARAKALRVPDSRLPSEDQVNPYLNVLFEPARASSYKLTGTVAAHGGTVGALAFHPTKPLVVSGSDDGTWRMWAVQSAAEAELIMNGEGHKAWVADVDFHPGGASLATCAGDGVVKIWDLLTARCAATFSDHLQTTWGVAWHGDGAFLATASMDHTARLFDVPTGRVRQTFRGHVDSVNAVAWQPFSVNLATGSGDKTVSMWDARSGLCIQTFYGHTNSVNDVAFNMRGDAIASCDADGVVRLWDIRMVAERGSVALGRQPVHSLAFDRSGTVLAAGCEDGVVRILDASGAGGAGLALAESLRGHEDGVQAVAFDPSAQYLVSGGADRTVRIWSEGSLKGVGIPLDGGGGGGGRWEERAPSPGPDGDD
jgi:WD40 repeat protein